MSLYRCYHLSSAYLLVLLVLLSACSNISTTRAIAATATPSPGACSFPIQTTGGPAAGPPGQPPAGFQYPPSSYYLQILDQADVYLYVMCSPSLEDPAAILAFMDQTIRANGWTIITKGATTLYAVQTSAPQKGQCARVLITVGSDPIPVEWDLNFYYPTSCAP